MSEGVIKFALEFEAAPPLPSALLAEVNAWRRVMFLLGLIGRDPARYDGLGYGNISQRLEPMAAPPAERCFVISGSQTGGMPQLGPEHYARVTGCWPRLNRIRAEGPLPPSAESLTHGTLYGLDESIRFVVHAHSPEIWRCARCLGLSGTSVEAAYGTPALAQEIVRICQDRAVRQRGIFFMEGHEDGIVAFGPNGFAAATVLIDHFRKALQLV